MKPGRELDALIAERVMGFIRIDITINDEQKPLVTKEWLDEWDGELSDAYWWGRDIYQSVPHYSTQIADAWLVVEKLRSESIAMVVSTYGAREYSSCHFLYKGVCSETYWAATAPLAICLAALKAMSEDV